MQVQRASHTSIFTEQCCVFAGHELTIITLNPTLSFLSLSLSRRKKKCVRVNEEEEDRAGKANDNVSLPVTYDLRVVFFPFVEVVSDGLVPHPAHPTELAHIAHLTELAHVACMCSYISPLDDCLWLILKSVLSTLAFWNISDGTRKWEA